METIAQIKTFITEGKLQALRVLLEFSEKAIIAEIFHNPIKEECPAFLLACQSGHLEIVQFLVEHYNVDVSQRGLIHINAEKVFDAPALWVAAASGHIAIVKYLISKGADVNASTKSSSTPLRAACYDGHIDVVEYLVSVGANVELPNRHGHTCLMIACFKNHYHIAEFLIKTCKVNVNKKSNKGNTALHDSAESGSLEILIMLLNNGAIFQEDHLGVTPILAAAICGHARVIRYLITLTDIKEIDIINALELLGATMLDRKTDFAEAVKYWRQACELRDLHNCRKSVGPSLDVFFNLQEFTNEADLDALDQEGLSMMTLMIRERILSYLHPDTSYYIRLRGAIYADSGNYLQCIKLWKHALTKLIDVCHPCSGIIQNALLSFAELFAYMRNSRFDDYLNDISENLFVSDITEILEIAVEQLNTVKVHSFSIPDAQAALAIIVYLIALLFSLDDLTEEENHKIHCITYKFIQMKIRNSQGSTPLHLAVNSVSLYVGRYKIRQRFPLYPLIKCLLQCGADVNSQDNNGRTPLHYFLTTRSVSTDDTWKVVNLFLEYGAHIDTIDAFNESPVSLLDALSKETHVDFDRLKYVSLKCLCARVVISHQISTVCVPKHLKKFISLHSKENFITDNNVFAL